MNRSFFAISMLIWTCAAYPMEELFQTASINEERQVIKRAEISYEETCYFAKQNRCRIAKVNLDLLKQRNEEFTITAFEDLTPAVVEGAGLTRIRSGTQEWRGRWKDVVPEEEFPIDSENPKPDSAAYEAWRKEWDRELNVVKLQIQSFVLDKTSKTWGFVPHGWERVVEMHGSAVAERRSEQQSPLPQPRLESRVDPGTAAGDRMAVRAYEQIKESLDNARLLIDGAIRPPPEPGSKQLSTYYVVSLHNRETESVANNDFVLIYELDRSKIFMDDDRCDAGQCADGREPPVTQQDLKRQQKARAFENHMNMVKQRIAEDSGGGPKR